MFLNIQLMHSCRCVLKVTKLGVFKGETSFAYGQLEYYSFTKLNCFGGNIFSPQDFITLKKLYKLVHNRMRSG